MGYSSYNCLVCGRDMMSEDSHDTPEWMMQVVVYMPDGLEFIGRYTGFQSVETGETFFSKAIGQRTIDRTDDWSGLSPILFESKFDGDAADADDGYMSIHMWLYHYIYNPCCYHRSCWEAVGKPRGYRAPSLPSIEQGSGSGARMFGPASTVKDEDGYYDDDRDEGPVIAEPKPGPEAIYLWAVNSICYFFFQIRALAFAHAHAQEQRDMWIGFAETEALTKRIEEQLEND